jgi:hypothetical protein
MDPRRTPSDTSPLAACSATMSVWRDPRARTRHARSTRYGAAQADHRDTPVAAPNGGSGAAVVSLLVLLIAMAVLSGSPGRR